MTAGVERAWTGLTSEEAAARLASEGPNVLPTGRRRTLLAVAGGVAREPMFVMLVAAALLYSVIGDLNEAVTLASSVVLIFFIAAVQQGRTERALDALRDLSSPRAKVLRDGEVQSLPAQDLVPGDIISLGEGDRVPADGIVRRGTLSVDESLLTGEAAPVIKGPSLVASRMDRPGGDGSASLFSGTLVVSGRSIAEVVRTGLRSEMGKLGASLSSIRTVETPLQREVTAIVRKAATLALGLSIVLTLLRRFHDQTWIEATLSGLTLAIALLPEEFPVVLTVFLALGAWRMTKLGVLTRQVTALETLGAVDVLCTDKTGTLTLNKMTIKRLWTESADFGVPDGGAPDLPEEVHKLVEYAILASPRDPFDPMEKAFHALGGRSLADTEHLHPKWNAVREYPLRADLLAVAHVWRSPQSESLTVAAKGAPEAVFDLCHLDESQARRWGDRTRALAAAGMRVIAVARSPARLDRAPDVLHDIPFEMVGIVGFWDPLRPEVLASVQSCRKAGIRVLVITGDHAETARAIAKAVGLEAGRVLMGPEIDAVGDAELADRLATTDVVARAVPAHKHRIVQALRGKGLVVGMTGDGVNDAPALKSADVGIAMGARGTDVAREAAALVLEDDAFGSIVAAVRLGRRIYDNLRKAFAYIVAVHVPIAGLSLLPAVLGWPAVVAPIHVVFLELVIDPSCSVVLELEPDEPDVMDRAPRSKSAPLLGARRLFRALLSGAVVLAGILWVVMHSRWLGQPAATQRSLAFLGLVAGNLALLATSRSEHEPFWAMLGRSNPATAVLAAAVVAVTALLLGVGEVREFFHFGVFGPGDLALTLAASMFPILLLDTWKALFKISPKNSP
jgi:Ca2+-transporting ATPase